MGLTMTLAVIFYANEVKGKNNSQKLEDIILRIIYGLRICGIDRYFYNRRYS